MPGYTAQTWIDNNATYPLSAARMNVLESAVSGLKTLTYNVKDYGAVGNGTTDDSTAIQAALNDVPASNPNRGGVVYFPRGRYLCNTGLSLPIATQNVRLVGEGNSPAIVGQSGAGPTQLLVGSQQWGFTYNSANASTAFGGWEAENMIFAPAYALGSGSYVAPAATLTTSGTFNTAPLPSSGVVWIKDAEKVGKITYTGKTTTTLTGITVSNESPASNQTYVGASLYTDALGGIRSYRTSGIRMNSMSFCGFLNATDTARGFLNDGSANLSQYNSFHDVWVQECYIGVEEKTASSRWFECNFDATNGTSPTPGTGYLATTSRTALFVGVNVHGWDRLMDIDSAGSQNASIIGGRLENWTTDAVRFQNTVGAQVTGCSFNNFQNGAVGNAVNLGTGVVGAVLRLGNITSVNQKVATTTGVTGFCELQGAGTPEASETATVSSHYHRLDGGAGTSLYVKESGIGNTGWTGK